MVWVRSTEEVPLGKGIFLLFTEEVPLGKGIFLLFTEEVTQWNVWKVLYVVV